MGEPRASGGRAGRLPRRCPFGSQQRSPRPTCARLCRLGRNEQAQATRKGTRVGRDVVRPWLRRERGVRWRLRGARSPLRGHGSPRLLPRPPRLGRNRAPPDPPVPVCVVRAETNGLGRLKGAHPPDATWCATDATWCATDETWCGAARRTRRGAAGAARRRCGAPGELLDASQRMPRRACARHPEPCTLVTARASSSVGRASDF